MKKILTFLCLLLSPALASAQTLTTGGVCQLPQAAKDSLRSVCLTGKLSVGNNGDFRQMRDICYQLERVDMTAAECTAIPDNAFFAMHNLRWVALPRTLTSVGTQAFFACDNLSGQLAMPDRLTTIGASAFARCSGLSAIGFGKGLKSIGDFAFNGCHGLQGTLSLPDSLQSVGDGAFFDCYNLREVEIPASVKAIGDNAFAYCTRLSAVRVTAPLPPALSPTAFEGVNLEGCRLVVPDSLVEAYAEAPGWSVFFVGRETAAPADTTLALIPVPNVVQRLEGSDFVWSKLREIRFDSDLRNEEQHLLEILHQRTDFESGDAIGNRLVELVVDTTLTDPEAYVLDVRRFSVRIAGGSSAGVFYGIKTLEQLLVGNGSSTVCRRTPPLHIEDAPRTHVRELMVDPARTFIPIDELRALIPEMSRYKLNSLHLHLVDDQAWRIEIKAFPQLTEQGSTRVGMDDMNRPVSGFYTQQQMVDLVDYARQYYVNIVPEIELPGHEIAAIHVFPWLTCDGKQYPIRTTCGVSNELLCPGKLSTYTFLDQVFKELCDVFPGPYVHLGGDEAGNPALDCWTNCKDCSELKRKLGITTTDRSENWRLQQYMFDTVIQILREKYGKTPMFWYETDFKEIQPGCVTFAWRHGLTNAAIDAAIRNKAKIMMCPGEHCYLDYPMARGDMPEKNWGMPVTSLEQTYKLDPAWGRDARFEQENLFGVAGTLWSECMPEVERISYMAYPRAMAIAEAGWSRQANRSYPDFLRRLRPLLKDMSRRGGTYSHKF